MKRSDRIKGGIYGLLVGDALGVPYEFHPPQELPGLADIEFDPPDNFCRSHEGILPGTWSDDGAQALVLLNSLLENDSFNIEHFAKGLVDWQAQGFMAVGGEVFDIGNQTADSINQLKNGVSPKLSGGISEWSNGNGSLMRCLPLALWHRGSDEELIDLAFAQSSPTHRHPRAKLCCALYCLLARNILNEEDLPWEKAVHVLLGSTKNDAEKVELETKIRPHDEYEDISGSGYVVDSLHSARWASTFSNYEFVVKAAVSLGNDTDTTACIAGGIAGISYGFSSIPGRWINDLKGKRIVEPLIERLLAI